jgi:ABC-2 type transport system ATP-binding protein
MSDPTIEVSRLRKRFGPTLALDGMTFTISPGQVTGFIGPNGAGKSTTMRVILGLDAPDAGHALISGRLYRRLRRPLTQVGHCSTAQHCSRAGPPATTCCGWPTPRA